MPRSQANGKRKISVMTTAPVNLAAPKLSELTAGIDAACAIAEDGYTLGATASDEFTDKALCEEGNTKDFGASNFEGTLPIFRYMDPSTGAPDVSSAGVIGDSLFAATKTKGTELWIAVRETSKSSKDAWAASDECSVFHVKTDTWQFADGKGYIKRVVPLAVQGDSVVNAAAAAS